MDPAKLPPARVVTAVERSSSVPCIEPPICVEDSEEESSEEESSEEETVKEEIVRKPLKVFSKFSVEIVLETVIVQSAYVPLLREFKVMRLLPETAMVVLEEHEPP